MKSTYEILRRRYPAAEYALMSEVSDAAGFERSRSADYIVSCLWPSRGLWLAGIEVKSSRSDWLRELKKPQKAEDIFKFCDYFWLLTTADDVAKLEEIPLTWGWMAIQKDRIFIKKEAPKLEPKPITRNFLAALLKRAGDKSNFVHLDSIKEELDKAQKRGKESEQRRLKNIESDSAALRRHVQEYREASGVDIEEVSWRTGAKEIGKAVKFISDGGADDMQERLLQLEKTAMDICDRIKAGLEAIKPLTIKEEIEENG